jgi:prepilin-type N-terminal cleavage/methylation domain-containing protein
MGDPLMNRIVAKAQARMRHDGASGFTLIELMVAMLCFSIFLAIVGTSIVGLTRAASRIQVAAVSTNQELAVFQRFDRQIRYADGINLQGVGASGVYTYFEFRTPSDSTPNGLTMCTQWRYDPVAGTIASRQWTDGNLSSQTPWNVQLTNVANDGGPNYPFNFVPAGGPITLEEEILTLDAGNANVKGGSISTTFVARNSGNASGVVCPAAGSRQ